MRKKRLVSLAALCALAARAAAATHFIQTNLVSDVPGQALITDPNLKNAWGISQSATGPFGVSANGTGVSTSYNVDPVTQTPATLGPVISIAGDGSVTGQASNSNSAAFVGDSLLFGSVDGTISGWRPTLGSATETFQPAGTVGHLYSGVALASISGKSYLYAANFRAGTIDVLNGTYGQPSLTGNFSDPTIPAGFAPFNIQNLGGNLYVTYALQDAFKHDAVLGPGNGYVAEFDTEGNFLNNIASGGTLNTPWGLAIAPASFGEFAGDLLVANFGDGRINAYHLGPNSYAGQLTGYDSNPLAIDGLRGLAVGNGTQGSTDAVYFSAGPNGGADGLFGVIQVPEPASLFLLALGVIGLLVKRRTHIIAANVYAVDHLPHSNPPPPLVMA